MSNIRLLAIVLLATAAAACTTDPLPARPAPDVVDTGTGTGTGTGTAGAIGTSTRADAGSPCADPANPVYCGAIGTFPGGCWASRTVCSTITNCGTSAAPEYKACGTAGYHPDCSGTTCLPNSGGGGASGSTGRGGMGGTTSGIGGTSGSTTSGGIGGTTAACPTSLSDSTCNVCDKQMCCTQAHTCANDTSCFSLADCVANCTTSSCESTCGASYPSGVAPLNAWMDCLASACGVACNSSGGTGGNSGAGGRSTVTFQNGGAPGPMTGGAAGGSPSAGGSIALVCPAATWYPDCDLTTGVVTGNACTPYPPIFAIDASCTIGQWANDGTSSGYFYDPWCNSPTASPSDCTLTMACAPNSMHITGSYLGSGGPEIVEGNGGWGLNLWQTTYPDAGPGCQMISGAGLTGLTVDINVTTLPAGNHLYIGMILANGNSGTYTAVLAAGAQTLHIPWACIKNDKVCGTIPGPGITNFYFAFDWFNDSGASHAVDITISNLGFY